MKPDESVEEYVARLAQELEDEFQRLGPGTVCAFVAETMTGAVSKTILSLATDIY
jgi:adenosylmethionine-8-amino-7-oxononanoate aminotransferase